MDLLKYALAVMIGGALTLLGNYIIENTRLKNERFKFRLEKMISVGEEYYKFSTYSLIYFTSMIDTMNKREDFMSDGAHHILNVIDEENQRQIEKIRENNITITTASMYFDVTNSEQAVSQMLLLKEAKVRMHHASSISDIDQYDDATNEYTTAVASIIKQIKLDQLTITTAIRDILSSNKRKQKSPDR